MHAFFEPIYTIKGISNYLASYLVKVVSSNSKTFIILKLWNKK